MSSTSSRPVAHAGKPIKLLLVDDDDVDREKFRRLLRRSGLVIQIEDATSGREALARLSQSKFDCVVVDYRLGDTTGTDLVRSIKQASDTPIPVIMVTGLGDERVAVDAMREGVYDYLSKNRLKPQHLASAIEGSLRWAQLEEQLAGAQERLRRLGLFDTLTTLPNRNLFFDRLEQVLQSAQRNGDRFSLMMMDLNLFKEINDTMGHEAGDKVLAEIGRRLSRLTRAADTCARTGGDEFAAVLVGCDSAAGAMVVADKIHAALHDPMMIDDELVRVTVSIGVALFPTHGCDSRTLLAHADQAMYRAKRSSRACEVYSPGPREARSVLIASHLPEALERGELFLEYQPKVHLATGALAGVEALARWSNPRLGLVAPSDFIPAAECSSLIKPMTYAILGSALDQAVKWRGQGRDISIAVNLSARMLDDDEVTTRCCAALEERGCSRGQLTLEITETALMASPLRAQQTLQSLHDAGIMISIDDFGAGYTSLKYLRDFQVSEIKIDKLFIRRLQSTSRDVAIVRSIAALSRGFNLKLVAEGIEDEGQCVLLRELGCDYGQGFAIGPPMSADRLEQWWNSRLSMLGRPALEHNDWSA
jgi:diguanylate cyclase (GGDEF)-like protein